MPGEIAEEAPLVAASCLHRSVHEKKNRTSQSASEKKRGRGCRDPEQYFFILPDIYLTGVLWRGRGQGRGGKIPWPGVRIPAGSYRRRAAARNGQSGP